MINLNNVHKHPLTTMVGCLTGGFAVVLNLIVAGQVSHDTLLIAFACGFIGALSKDPGGLEDE
jgi:hypothetical protein